MAQHEKGSEFTAVTIEDVIFRILEVIVYDRTWAFDVSMRSGLPGTGDDGAADALRHMLGSAALTERYGAVTVLAAGIFVESVEYAKGRIEGEDHAKASRRFHMDIRNNTLGVLSYVIAGSLKGAGESIIGIIANGPRDEGEQSGGFVVSKNEGAGLSNARATWYGSGTKQVKEKQWQEEVRTAIAERERIATVRTSEGDEWPQYKDEQKTHPDAPGENFPESETEFRQLLIDMGVGTPQWPITEEVLNECLPSELRLQLLRDCFKRNALIGGLGLVLADADTPSELRAKLRAWMTKNFPGGTGSSPLNPHIEDPQQDFGQIVTDIQKRR